ncbi:MAG: DNA mismatch repair endonuclease MutL [Gemmatimonadota bacterium]
MARVQVLPEGVVNKIAAGEVVERPSSVVKELVDNALDAGASRIEIALESAGLERITVADDGLGMDRDDAVQAFERHATSKINAAADLDRIETLGFRGEALPSIAAVSRVTLETAPEGGGLAGNPWSAWCPRSPPGAHIAGATYRFAWTGLCQHAAPAG